MIDFVVAAWCMILHRKHITRICEGDWCVARCGKCGDVWPEHR